MIACLLGPPPYETIFGRPELPAGASGSVQQPNATFQQPILMQNTSGPGQTFLSLQAYPQSVYYVGSPYSPLEYINDPIKIQNQRMCLPQYITLPNQPDIQFTQQVIA